MRRAAGWCMIAAMAFAAGPAPASAGGDRLNISGMGMGRTGTAGARGVDAIGVNPANLHRADGPTVEIAIIPFGAYVGSDFLSYDLFTTYFTGTLTDTGRVPRVLSDGDKQRLLESFEDGTGHAQLDAASRPLAVLVNVGPLAAALSMTEHVRGDAALPRAYAEFLLYGNPAGSRYDFSSSAGAASWVREFALTAAVDLPAPAGVESLRGGAAVKLIQGIAYSELVRFNTLLMTSQTGVLDGSLTC